MMAGIIDNNCGLAQGLWIDNDDGRLSSPSLLKWMHCEFSEWIRLSADNLCIPENIKWAEYGSIVEVVLFYTTEAKPTERAKMRPPIFPVQCGELSMFFPRRRVPTRIPGRNNVPTPSTGWRRRMMDITHFHFCCPHDISPLWIHPASANLFFVFTEDFFLQSNNNNKK